MAKRFPAHWEPILSIDPSVYKLDFAEQHKLRKSIQVLVAEKNWEGCRGLVLEDEHRVTISSQLAKMTLGFEQEFFDEVRSILVYPDAYVAKDQNQIGSGVVVESRSDRLGEAWYRGPVILSWQDVLATAVGENYGRNVVVHEFAHQLDMRNGAHADGVPVIESGHLAAKWVEVMQREYDDLVSRCHAGEPSLLDCYGASSLSEFFAVSSEAYFEEPGDLRIEWPELFDQLDSFYRPLRIPGRH